MATETKLEKFQRLAPARIEKVDEALRVFGNLSSANYETDKALVWDTLAKWDQAIVDLRVSFGVPALPEDLDTVMVREFTPDELERLTASIARLMSN